MSNHCWNAVTIIGDKDVLDKLEELFNKYENYDYFTQFGNSFFEGSKKYKPVEKENYLEYGTRWWDFETNRQEDKLLQINGDSAWGPPTGLLQMISDEYQVRCSIDFSESGCDFAGEYIYNNGEVESSYDCSYSQHLYNCDGIDQVISEYLYDEECFESYKNAQNFIISLGIEDVRSYEIEKLEKLFEEHLPVKEEEPIIEEERVRFIDNSHESDNNTFLDKQFEQLN